MKLGSISNQKGEIVIGVMVVMMVVMLFGGMHLMHGDHNRTNDHDSVEHKHDHQKEEMHNMHNDEGEHSVPDQGQDK